MSELTNPQAVNGSNIRNMKWTDAYDDVLLRIMLEMRKEGKVMPRGFISEGWGLITKEMQTKLGPQFSKDKLKNRVKSFKKWYNAMKGMLNLSGFGWDEERKKVMAEDEVWDDYMKAHARASMYRSRHMPDYYIMFEIFGDSIADGQEQLVTNDIPQSPPSIHNNELDDDLNVDEDVATHNDEGLI